MSRWNIYRKPAVNPDGSWAKASHELTWAIEDVTPRGDLIVKIAPDAAYDDSAYDDDGNLIINPETGEPAGQQHAAITFLEIGVVEINPKLLPEGFNPEDLHPLNKQDRKQYPVLWGAAIHEAAHANYSMWVLEANDRIRNRKVTSQERQWLGAALLLEETRIEKKQIDARPQDQPWIEAAGMHVAVTEFTEAAKAAAKTREENPDADENKLSRYKCGRAAALSLARVDSGSIYRNQQIADIENIVRDAFGDEDFNELQEIWRAAQNCADDDLETMLELGHRWFDLTQDAGDDQQPIGISVSCPDDGDGESEQDGLGKALADAAEQAEKEASGVAEEERREKRINAQRNAAQKEVYQQQQAQTQAQKTFGSSAGAPNGYGHPVKSYRQPTLAEVNLARVTKQSLEAVYVPEKIVTKVTKPTPPGRLNTWAMQQRRLQRRAGIIPNAEPFTYMDRKHVTTPPLKVGIVQDVSWSQATAAAAAVSGAWSLAKAANEIVDAKVAMVSFGNDVHSIIKPLTKIEGVPVLRANAGTNYFLESLSAVEGELQLTNRGAARLLVILTDGQLNATDEAGRDAALWRLLQHGVKILWLDTDGGGYNIPKKMPGLRISVKTSGDYDVIPSTICREAVEALKQ